MMASLRNANLDALRGLAIILMIIGHVQTPFRDFIFSFHMPLFFFISGYLYKEKTLNEVLERNFKKVILPYLVTCMAIWFCWIVTKGRWDWGLSIILANGSMPVYNFTGYAVGPLWFLMCYFVSIVGFKYLLSVRNYILRLVIVLLLWGAAYLYNKHFGLLPLSLLNAIPAVFCMLFGYALKSDDSKKILVSPIALSCGFIIWICCVIYGNVSMASFIYKLGPLQIIGAFYATYFLYTIIVKTNIGGDCPKTIAT